MDLSLFNTSSLYEAATDLFKQLNIQLNSNTTGSLPAIEILKEHYRENETFDAIRNTYFIGIVDESIFREVGLFDERYSYKQALEQAERNYDGLMLFALELDKHPTRTEISDLTRSFNRISQKMPVGLLIKYENEDEAVISISISERFKYKQHWRQGEKAGKVIILRDIHTKTTHAGHIRILKDLTKPVAVTSYAQLHAHWLEVLDVSILNKRFFQELANWYFWAMDLVSFPDDIEKDKEVRNATNLIRLITRIIFIWFIKEKRLVPNKLFRKESLKNIVVDFMKNNKSENFYHAILQNLFFGTLNQVIEERGFVKDGTFQENRAEYGVKNLFRYADKFLIPEADVIELFKEIPFLNGGLFDCLDKPDDDGKIIYVDGFSRNPKKQSHIPDYIFFTTENEIDLNKIYGTRNKRYKVQGLINLLESYKFTVAENTPIEEEIALDPELLGKVFENLLASYNPETKTTARKQTGSFYTPREIVNYMVDESLIEYLKEHCGKGKEDYESRLRELFSYSEEQNPFNEEESIGIIESLNNCKILDPACGSGAFPMGILHRMVHLLNKLDSGNILWKEIQKQKAVAETKTAYEINDHDERKRRLEEIDDVFENNTSDYGRKLYLIENCIYGIDIQPIAVQIAKLRFFISLIIDQNKQEHKENFGIRSLPNLETKFVAANTLVSLEKPQMETGDIFNQEIIHLIKELSKELKEIRHNYFNAKKRYEKIRFQEQDKDIRKKISSHLIKVGHTSKNANKIASFDPYDQNHFADWFDSEWMFGSDVRQGFDIVIGNPPYVVTKRSDFTQYEWGGDLYTMFYELSIKSLLQDNGILSLITPRFFLFNQINSDMRKFLVEKTHIISITECNPFDAVTENAISIIKKSTPQTEWIDFYLHDNESIHFENRIEKNWVRSNINYEINPSLNEKDFALISKIKSDHKTLSDISISKRGAEIGKSELKNSSHGKPILLGYDVGRFSINHTGARIQTTHKEYQRLKRIFELKNIVLLRRVSKDLVSSVVSESTAFSKNLYAIIPYEGYSPEFICGLLNSKVLNYYYKRKFSTKKEDVFPEIQTYLFEQLPISLANSKLITQIIKLVKEIMNQKSMKLVDKVNLLEDELDNCVFTLYGLRDNDIQIIESETLSE